MSEQVEAACPIDIWDGWRSRECRRPVKRDGMCGVHAAAKERRERNDAARAAKSRETFRLAEEKAERWKALVAAGEAVERIWALLDGAPMVTQADVRRALEGTSPPAPEASAGVGEGVA